MPWKRAAPLHSDQPRGSLGLGDRQTVGLQSGIAFVQRFLRLFNELVDLGWDDDHRRGDDHERPIISYFFEPIMRTPQDAMGER